MQGIADKAVTEDQIPPALRNRPVLNQFQQCYWDMYQDLSGSRQYTSGGAAEIPYPTKILWLDENHMFDPDDRRDYLQMVTLLDNTYLKHHYKK